MPDSTLHPNGPRAYDIVEIVDRRAPARLHAVVEVVQEPNLLLRLERAIQVPERAPVRWFDGDVAWQAASHVEQIDDTSIDCRLAPSFEWERAPVRQSLRAAVNNSPVLLRRVESEGNAPARPTHAVCVDISASGCRTTWPGNPPAAGDRVEIAWEVGEDDGQGCERLWITAQVARIIDLPFGKRQVGLRFEPTDADQAERVRELHQTWLNEHRRRLAAGIAAR